MRQLVLAWLIAAVCAAGSGVAAAQTTSARAESMEVTSRADELLAAGNYKRAAQRYRRAAEIDETNERAYIGLSAALDSLARHDEALDVLRTAESLLGWTPDIGIQRGIHQSRLERWDAAVASLERALAARPGSFDAAYYLAGAQLAAEHWDAAVDAFDRYLETRPDSLARRDTAVKTRRAYALISAGKLTRARRALEAVLDDDPDSLSAQMLLFTVLARAGNCNSALALYRDIEQIADAAPSVRYNAAVCQFRTGDERKALSTLDEYAAAAAPPRALLLRARIHVSLGDDANAEASYRAAIAAGVAAEVELARWLGTSGNHEAVIELLWPMVADTADAEVLALAAEALATRRDTDRAIAATARWVELQPTARSWSLHGRILLARRQWSDAEQAFTRALEAAPNKRDAAVGLRQALEPQATAAFRGGDANAAHALLTRAIAADPSADGAAFNLALIELGRGKPGRAIELVAPRIDRLAAPDRGRLVLGRAYLQSGDAEAAVRQLEAVVTNTDAPADIKRLALAHLAHALASTAPDRALEQIAKARKLGGDSATLDDAEARAQLTIAERLYRRDALKQLPRAIGEVDRAALAPGERARADLIELYAVGQSKGLPAALRALKAMSEDELAALAPRKLSAKSLRHAIAVDLGARFIRRSADYRRYLRSHIRALHPAARSSTVTAKYVTSWYTQMLGWAIAKPADALAKSIAKDAPASVQTPAFEHNAIIATATTRRGEARLTKAQVTQLEALAATIPQALVNLAIDAERRGDHAAVLGYLEKIPGSKRTRSISEWIRWEGLLYDAR